MAGASVSGSHEAADAGDVEMNGEKAVSKMKVKQDTMLKEKLRQCAEDAESKTVAKLVELGKEKADLLVDQMREAVANINDKTIKKMTAFEEQMQSSLVEMD